MRKVSQPCTWQWDGSSPGVYPAARYSPAAGTKIGARNAACPTLPIALTNLRGTIIDLDFIQWPAMLVTVAAAWLVGSQSKLRRRIGFWAFLASNVLWITWGWTTAAWALVVLQVALAILNIRGARKNDPENAAGDDAAEQAGQGTAEQTAKQAA